MKASDGTCQMPGRTPQTLGLAFLSGAALGAGAVAALGLDIGVNVPGES